MGVSIQKTDEDAYILHGTNSNGTYFNKKIDETAHVNEMKSFFQYRDINLEGITTIPEGEERDTAIKIALSYSMIPYSRQEQDLIVKICRFWHYVKERMNRQWHECFSMYLNNISEKIHIIDQKYKAKHLDLYLDAIFENIKGQIERDTRLGCFFEKCKICGHESAKETKKTDSLTLLECLICSEKDFKITFLCAECGAKCTISEPLELGPNNIDCTKCNKQITIEDIKTELDIGNRTSYKEAAIDIICQECEEDIIEHHGYYICLQCHVISNYILQCD